MKRISLLLVVALALSVVAAADIIPTWIGTTLSVTGSFTWTYTSV